MRSFICVECKLEKNGQPLRHAASGVSRQITSAERAYGVGPRLDAVAMESVLAGPQLHPHLFWLGPQTEAALRAVCWRSATLHLLLEKKVRQFAFRFGVGVHRSVHLHLHVYISIGGGLRCENKGRGPATSITSQVGHVEHLSTADRHEAGSWLESDPDVERPGHGFWG